MRASILDINRYLENKGYVLTADNNENGLYQCDIYKDGQFLRAAKNQFLTWDEAQRQTSIEMFNWFISKE